MGSGWQERSGDLRSIGFYQSTVVQQKKSSLGLLATQHAWLIYLGRTIGKYTYKLLVLSHNSILGGSHLWVVMWSNQQKTGGVMWLPPGQIVSKQVSSTQATPQRPRHIVKRKLNMAKSLIITVCSTWTSSYIFPPEAIKFDLLDCNVIPALIAGKHRGTYCYA